MWLTFLHTCTERWDWICLLFQILNSLTHFCYLDINLHFFFKNRQDISHEFCPALSAALLSTVSLTPGQIRSTECNWNHRIRGSSTYGLVLSVISATRRVLEGICPYLWRKEGLLYLCSFIMLQYLVTMSECCHSNRTLTLYFILQNSK